jgi:HEAT repeats
MKNNHFNGNNAHILLRLLTVGIVTSAGFPIPVFSSTLYPNYSFAQSKKVKPYKVAQVVLQFCDEEDVRSYITEMLATPWDKPRMASELAQACGQKIIPILETLLKQEKDYASQETIVIVLVKIGGEPSIRMLTSTLANHPDQKVRAIAAEALGYFRSPTAIKPLTTSLENSKEDSKVRQASASALGSIGGTAVVAPLVNAMKNIKNPLELRKSAANALVKTKDLAIDPLVLILKDSKAPLQTQYWAVRILGQINSPKTIQVLTGNKSQVIKILEAALKIPNDIVDFDRSLGKSWLCQYAWFQKNWSRCG